MLFDVNFVLPKDCTDCKYSFYLKIVLAVSTVKPLRKIHVFTRHLEHLGASDSSFSVQEQSA